MSAFLKNDRQSDEGLDARQQLAELEHEMFAISIAAFNPAHELHLTAKLRLQMITVLRRDLVTHH